MSKVYRHYGRADCDSNAPYRERSQAPHQTAREAEAMLRANPALTEVAYTYGDGSGGKVVVEDKPDPIPVDPDDLKTVLESLTTTVATGWVPAEIQAAVRRLRDTLNLRSSV